jgi:predicted transcriptional regulator of viral defense system
MQMSFYEAILPYAEHPINKQLLLDILKDYKRPHDKIDELVKKQLLVQVKRGLYIPGPKLNIATPEPFLIANHLYGPSYVSLDSALSHWGLIPERVYEISSVTTNLSKKFTTAAGRFSYVNMKLPYYSFGIKQVMLTKKQTVLMASPEKALWDKIIYTSGILLRSVKQTTELLIEDFRIDKQALRNLDSATMNSWMTKAPKQTSLPILVKTLQSL